MRHLASSRINRPMPPIAQHVVIFAGRVLLSLVFLFAAVGHLIGWSGSVAAMRAEGMAPESIVGRLSAPLLHILLLGAVATLLLGGLSVLLGLRARAGAVLLMIFLIPTTLIFHDFWAQPAASQAFQLEMIQFLKNLGLFGGLLFVLGFGAGGLTLELFLPRRRAEGGV